MRGPVAAQTPATESVVSATPATTTIDTAVDAIPLNTGDGEWAPSHDEELALIPVCSGPIAFLQWLGPNLADHGADFAKFITDNFNLLRAIVNGGAQPWRILELVLKPFVQVPVYAINDTLFHIPPTLGDILSFCSSARS